MGDFKKKKTKKPAEEETEENDDPVATDKAESKIVNPIDPSNAKFKQEDSKVQSSIITTVKAY